MQPLEVMGVGTDWTTVWLPRHADGRQPPLLFQLNSQMMQRKIFGVTMAEPSVERSHVVSRPIVADSFVPLPRRDRSFTSWCGDFYLDAERSILATQIADQHLNPVGIAHGGMLATLVDSAFGATIQHKLNLAVAPVTISLNIDYISPANPGDWVEAHVELHKIGRRISNASCSLRAGDRLVLRASGTFMMQPRNIPTP
jgi:uncharacterized protein (TIGR00369 family)